MTTYISSEAQNHGMNKQTNNVIEHIFRFHNKEKERERICKNSKKITKH